MPHSPSHPDNTMRAMLVFIFVNSLVYLGMGSSYESWKARFESSALPQGIPALRTQTNRQKSNFLIHPDFEPAKTPVYFQGPELSRLEIKGPDDLLAVESSHRANDRLHVFHDEDGDGVFEFHDIFADGFTDELDGPAWDLSMWEDEVLFCVPPRLWLLKSSNQDVRAIERVALLDGIGNVGKAGGSGIRCAVAGADGWIYIAFGFGGLDLNPVNPFPDPAAFKEGGVAKCRPDGTQWTWIARGIRKPLVLFFNRLGDLFLIDEIEDEIGSQRLLHIAEGGDYGWRYSTEADLWGADQNDYLIGAKHDPNEGGILPATALLHGATSAEIYDGRQGQEELLVCGDGQKGPILGLHSMRIGFDGAGYALSRGQVLFDGIAAEDVAQDAWSGIYLLENGLNERGSYDNRVYFIKPGSNLMPQDFEGLVRGLEKGLHRMSIKKLISSLSHPSAKVRSRVREEILSRYEPPSGSFLQNIPFGFGNAKPLEQMMEEALNGKNQNARIQSLWGVGRIAQNRPELGHEISELLSDPDAELRTQAVRILASIGYARHFEDLESALRDVHPRVRCAALDWWRELILDGVSSLPSKNSKRGEDLKPLSLDSFMECFNQLSVSDPWIRHRTAGVLASGGYHADWREYYRVPSLSVRRTFLHALKQLRHEDLLLFLEDPLSEIQEETARILLDTQLDAGLASLASFLDDENRPWELKAYSIRAHQLIGEAGNIQALMRLCEDPSTPAHLFHKGMQSLFSMLGHEFEGPIQQGWRGLEFTPRGGMDLWRRFALKLLDRKEIDKVKAGIKIQFVLQPDGLDPKPIWSEYGPELDDESVGYLIESKVIANPDIFNPYYRDPNADSIHRLIESFTGLHQTQGLNANRSLGIQTRVLQFASVYRNGTDKSVFRQFLKQRIKNFLEGDGNPSIQLDIMAAALDPDILNDELDEWIRTLHAREDSGRQPGPFEALYQGGHAARGLQILQFKPGLNCFCCHAEPERINGSVDLSFDRLRERSFPPKLLDSRLRWPSRDPLLTLDFYDLLTKGGRVNIETQSGLFHEGVLVDFNEKNVIVDSAVYGKLSIPVDQIVSLREVPVFNHAAALSRLSWIEYRDVLAYLSEPAGN